MEFDRIFDAIPDLIMVIDNQHRIRRMNHAMMKVLDLDVDALKDIKCHECLHGTLSPPSTCPHSKLVQDGQTHTEEIFVEKLKRHFHVSVSPLTDSDGQLLGCVHVARDISRRKAREKRLEKLCLLRTGLIDRNGLYEKFRFIQQHLKDLCGQVVCRVWMVQDDGRDTIGNHSIQNAFALKKIFIDPYHIHLMCDSTTIAPEALVVDFMTHERGYLRRLVTGKDSKLISNNENQPSENTKHYYIGHRMLSVTGSPIGVFSVFSRHPLGTEDAAFFQQIAEATTQIIQTEKAAEALKQSEKCYRQLFENLIDVYFRVNAAGDVIMASPSLEAILGWPLEQIIGTDASHCFMYPDEHRLLMQQIKAGGEVLNYELHLKKPNGISVWVSLNAKCLEKINGEFSGFEGLFRDITKNKQTEEFMHVQRDLGIALGNTQRLDDALAICLDAALEVQGVNCGGIYLVDKKGNLDLMVHRGMPPEHVRATTRFDNNSAQARLVLNGKPVFETYDLLIDGFSLTPEQKRIRDRSGFRSIGIIPMSYENTVIGCLNVASTANEAFTDFSRFCLETIAAQMAGALARIRSEQALKISQHNLKTLFETLDDLLFILDPEGRIIGFNPAVKRYLGYSEDELMGMNVLDVHPRERRHEVPDILKAMLDGRTDMCPLPIEARDGRLIAVETKVNAGIWDGQPALFGISRDIRPRLAAEKARRLSEARLAAAIDAIDEGFVIFDAQDRLVMCNAKYLEIYKELKDQVRPGVQFEHLVREIVRHGLVKVGQADIEEWVAERIKQHRACTKKVEQALSDGRWLRIVESRMDDGSTVGFRMDITDIKMAEELAQKTLRENEILLKEIHHRVKNNLAVISSLLNLQAKRNEDITVQRYLSESQSRIRIMSLLHETLYQSKDLSVVYFEDYIRKLVRDLVLIYADLAGKITVEFDIQKINLDIGQAVCCGIILNEFVTNSFKYAFPGNRRGTIRISTKMIDDNEVEFKLQDNGVGFPPDHDWKHSNTLGLLLISLMAEQMRGTWGIESRKGLKLVVKWHGTLPKQA